MVLPPFSPETETEPFPRFATARLLEALSDTPVVLLHGPRQSGKSTLARAVGDPAGYAYLSFDDENRAAAAKADPVGFVEDLPPHVVLDEVQRVPEIFTSLKAAVDRDRTPGRFLLTGSANVLLVPRLSDSLAGRLEALRLHPLAQCEIERRAPRFLDALFAGEFPREGFHRLGSQLAERVVAGGYPSALARSGRRRRAWYDSYLETLVQRDVRDLSRIASLDALPRLLAVAAGRTSRLINIAELAAPFQLSRPTIRDYVTLLTRVFLIELLPPWHSNRLSRLVKTPKLHLGDTGLASALLGLDSSVASKDRSLFGQLLETFVMQELKRQASWREEPISFFHFRDKNGIEVDLVLEQGIDSLVGIEVKASSTVGPADFRGLHRLRDATPGRFAAGIVLYDGASVHSFGERLFAVPIEALWSMS